MTICLDKTLQSAVTHYNAGHYVEAIHSYTQALDLAPDLPELHTNIGSAFLACGQLQKALEHFRRTESGRVDDYRPGRRPGGPGVYLGNITNVD